jgi:hypothetical protein
MSGSWIKRAQHRRTDGNNKTANALGLKTSESFLLCADDVIE